MFNTIASFVDCYMEHVGAVAAAKSALSSAGTLLLPDGKIRRVTGVVFTTKIGVRLAENRALEEDRLIKFEVER